jgi:DNA-directed RNA polymerase specialized sigma24 family protein
MAEPPTNDPLLWINKRGERGRRADRDVIEAAHRIWPRVLYYVRKKRGDVSEAAEILEKAVYSVSQAIRERGEREPIHHLDSYLFHSFVRQYNRDRTRQSRIQYFDSGEVLEALAAGRQDNWVKTSESKILHGEMLGALDPKTRTMCVLRDGGYSWADVGRHFGIKAHNAEVQFWYGIEKARHLLDGASAPKGSRRQEK